MNEYLLKVTAFVNANKAMVIRVGSTIAGTLLGAAVGSLVAAGLEDEQEDLLSDVSEEPAE